MDLKKECHQFGNYLHNYLTYNGKCAHYIERPTIYYHETEYNIRFCYVYISDEIEYKLTMTNLKSLVANYLMDKKKEDLFRNIKDSKNYIVQRVGTQHKQTNISVGFMKSIKKNMCHGSIVKPSHKNTIKK